MITGIFISMPQQGYVMSRRMFVVLALAFAATAAHAEAYAEPSSILQSLPAEVQKDIESVRAACREYESNTGSKIWVSSGDNGLTLFTVSGAPAVMVNHLDLCGDECLKGANCSIVAATTSPSTSDPERDEGRPSRPARSGRCS